MKNIKKINIFTAIFALVILTGTIFAIANKYTPGETLNPSCNPGEENCTVEISSGGKFIDGSDTNNAVYTAGNVGIGTTSPSSKLHIVGDIYSTGIAKFDGGIQVDGRNMINSDGGIHTSRRAGGDNTHYGYFEVRRDDNTRGAYFGYGNGADIVNLTLDNASRLDITSGNVYIADNLGVGITLPTEKLEVDGNVKATDFIYSSDRRLKKNIKGIDSALAKIIKLNGVSFEWKKDNKKSLGLIAQDVEKVFPEIVWTGKDEQKIKGVKYASLIAPLIESIKELNKKNIELEERIKRLESKR